MVTSLILGETVSVVCVQGSELLPREVVLTSRGDGSNAWLGIFIGCALQDKKH